MEIRSSPWAGMEIRWYWSQSMRLEPKNLAHVTILAESDSSATTYRRRNLFQNFFECDTHAVTAIAYVHHQ